jgi:hypothetical protein
LNEKDKSLSESDENHLSLSETSLLDISIEEIDEIDEKIFKEVLKKKNFKSY